LSKTGSGTLTLSAASSYAGLTSVNAGTLQAGISNAFSSSSAYTVGSGATLDLNSLNQTIGSLAGAGNVTLGSATLTAGRDNSTAIRTFSGAISGSGGSLTKTGTDTLVLSGPNTYSGGTTINGGALQIGDGGTTGSIAGNVADNTILVFNRSDSTPFGGIVSGSGALQQIGTGTLTLSGLNSYSGGTFFNAGTLAVSGDANLGAAIGPLIFNGGALQFLSGFSSSRIVALSTGGGVIDTNGNNATLDGMIGGVGSLSKIGTGTLLTGANSYSGGTTLSAGTLGVGANTALGSGTVGMASGTTLQAATANLALANAMALTGTSTMDTQANALTLSGVIGDGTSAGGFTKIGTGTLTLAGADTYTGPTAVKGGTLLVNGSLAGSGVTVESGAVLGGSGTITNAVTVANGGILAPGPGTAPGTLTVGPLTLNSGSILAYQLGTANVIGGQFNDLTNVTGNLTLAGTLNVTNSNNFELGAYRLINYGGGFNVVGSGLAIGTLPASFSGLIQTTIPGQVNLVVNAPGVPVQYWDGTTTNGDGVIHGGTGTWNGTNTSWTAPNGAINASWQSGFGIFAGTAGTVTATAPLSYQGLQFSSDGYQVRASGSGALTPTGAAPIRVDAGVMATISAPITGSGGLIKSDLGTLVLSGTDSYSGGTSLIGGTLSLTNGGAIGSGSLALNPGTTLDLAGSFALGNATTFSGTALVNVGGGNSATLGGVMSDAGTLAGVLAKTGLGTLTLAGANSYSGGTLIAAGTLGVGTSTALGSGTVGISSGATLQAAASNLTLANTVALTGLSTIDTQADALTLSASWAMVPAPVGSPRLARGRWR
jgi:autotransporter-associated beta strand protein